MTDPNIEQQTCDGHTDVRLLEAAPDDVTHDELDMVCRIRQQLNPAFTVHDLRNSRAQATRDALSTANMLQAAGHTHQADVYRTLARQLTPTPQPASDRHAAETAGSPGSDTTERSTTR